MRPLSLFITLIIFHSCSENNSTRIKEQKKDSKILSGSFINDTTPHGTIKTFDSNGRSIAIENFYYGKLEGEAIYYYEKTGTIKIKTTFRGGIQSGFKYTFDSLGKLLSKANYYFGKEIGPDILYDSIGNVSEYSFQNFENAILYYCYFEKSKNKYTYPSDTYLIHTTTELITINNKGKLYIFLYLLNPPKLSLQYRICTTDKNDSLITVKEILSDNFFYEYYLTLSNDQQKVAIVLDKYDSLTQKKSIIVKYLKTSYP